MKTYRWLVLIGMLWLTPVALEAAGFDGNTIGSLPIGNLDKVEGYMYPRVTQILLGINIQSGSQDWTTLLGQTNAYGGATNKADLTAYVNQQLALLVTAQCTNSTALYNVTVDCTDGDFIIANYYSEDFGLQGGQVPSLSTNAILNLNGIVTFPIPKIAYVTYTEFDALGNTNLYYDSRIIEVQTRPVDLYRSTNVLFLTSLLITGNSGKIVFGITTRGAVVEKVFDLTTGGRVRSAPNLSLNLAGLPTIIVSSDPDDPDDQSDQKVLWRSVDLKTWSPVSTLPGNTSGVTQYTDNTTGSGNRFFYRVKVGTP
jgi:hypothetical protein